MSSYAAVLHADLSECDHPGEPVIVGAGRPPLCPAGLEVTHVRAGGVVLTLDEAGEAFAAMARAWADSAAALLAMMADLASRWAGPGGPRGPAGDPVGDPPLGQLDGQLTLPGT